MQSIDTTLDDVFAKVLGDKFKRALAAPKPTAPKFMRNVSLGSRKWREQVEMRLLSGFGVEDIALQLDCHVSHVQEEVKRLRAAGDLAKWWGRV